MQITTLVHEHAAYDRWASERLLAATRALPSGALDAPVRSSYPSLRATWLHLRDAHQVWYCRLNGIAHRWPAEDATDLGTVEPHLHRLHAHVLGLNATALSRTCTYSDLRGNAHTQEAWRMVMHCLNHGTHHRGQVITLLRLLGAQEVPATDLVVFQRLRERGEA